MTHHIIIGAGPAGVIAAEIIRKHAPTDRITLIGDEPEAPYSRMAIPYLLIGKVGEEGTHLRHTPGHFAALRVELRGMGDVYMIGDDIAVPLRHNLDDASTLGQDRQLCALAAYSRARQACVVVDAGTAITVDFVDGEGVFQGGVIAPGLAMMLGSLHEQTSALPSLGWTPPDKARGPFGKDTKHAMLLGVQAAARGLVRHVVETYAEAYEAYPQIVATGGDAPALFEGDEVVEHVVPDLQLIGILEACRAAVGGEEEE